MAVHFYHTLTLPLNHKGSKTNIRGDTDVLLVYCSMETDARSVSIHSALAGCKRVPDKKLYCRDWQRFSTALGYKRGCLLRFKDVLMQFYGF